MQILFFLLVNLSQFTHTHTHSHTQTITIFFISTLNLRGKVSLTLKFNIIYTRCFIISGPLALSKITFANINRLLSNFAHLIRREFGTNLPKIINPIKRLLRYESFNIKYQIMKCFNLNFTISTIESRLNFVNIQ